MNIQLLMTGNELMVGDTIDSNSAMIAKALRTLGISIERRVTVSDSIELLCNELAYMTQHSDVVIMNGGLGPTVDDLTAEALAILIDQPLDVNAEAEHHVTTWCASRGFEANNANLKQARLPKTANVIPNPVGSAVGFSVTHNDCIIYCTPGVPSELRVMLQNSILPHIQNTFELNDAVLIDRLHIFGLGESNLQELLNNALPNIPDIIDVGFRAHLPVVEVKLHTPTTHANLHAEYLEKIKTLLSEYIVGENDITLTQSVKTLLEDQMASVCVAESCTGGLISSMLTELPGASAVFQAGFVTYSNEIKHALLNVPNDTLKQYGAVSEATILAMAKGALAKSESQYVIAVSGIAGPEGGTDEKPVGLAWLAWGDKQTLHTGSVFFPFQRNAFQKVVAAGGLDLLRRHLSDINCEPRYIRNYSTHTTT